MEGYKERVINSIFKNSYIKRISEEQNEILNDALLCWINDSYLQEVPRERIRPVSNLLSILKIHDAKQSNEKLIVKEVVELISHYRAVSRRENNYNETEVEGSDNNQIVKYFSKKMYEDELSLDHSEADDEDVEKNEASLSIRQSNEIGLFFAGTSREIKTELERSAYIIISHVLRSNKSQLSDKSYNNYVSSFVYFLETSSIIDKIRSMKAVNASTEEAVLLITSDLLFMYDILIKIYCDYDYDTIEEMMSNRSSSRKYINLWSLIRTKLTRILRNKVEYINKHKSYPLFDYIK